MALELLLRRGMDLKCMKATNGYSVGGIFGCVAAAIVAVPLFGFTFLSLALSDCAPGSNCWSGWGMVPIDGLVVLTVGFGVAVSVNAARKMVTGFRQPR